MITVYKGATKTVTPDPEPPAVPARKRATAPPADAPVTAPEPDTPVPTDG